MASDVDDYTEVLEELYEKYKGKGGGLPPEIRLLGLIVMSGVSYHFSQAIINSSGMTKTLQNNPQLLNKLFSGLNDEKIAPPHDNKELISNLNKFNQERKAAKTQTKELSPAHLDDKDLDRELDIIAQKNKELLQQIDDMTIDKMTIDKSEDGKNQILSGTHTQPRFLNNPNIKQFDSLFSQDDIFGDEVPPIDNINSSDFVTSDSKKEPKTVNKQKTKSISRKTTTRSTEAKTETRKNGDKVIRL